MTQIENSGRGSPCSKSTHFSLFTNKYMTLIPTLNGQEEEFCLQEIKKAARGECKDLVEQLVNCTRHKTFSLYFGSCEKERLASSECLSKFTNDLALNAARERVLEAKIKYLKDHNKLPSTL